MEFQIDSNRRLQGVLEQHGEALYALLKRLTLSSAAEDLLQDLFVRLGESNGFVTATDPGAFAFRAAINLAMDWRRRRKRASRFDAGLAEQAKPMADEPLIRLIRREEEDHMLDALVQISEPRRTALILRYLQQQPYEQVAESIGKTPHQTRSLVQKGLNDLRQLMSEPSHVQKGVADA